MSKDPEARSHARWGENLTFFGGYRWSCKMLTGTVKFLKSQIFIVLSTEDVTTCYWYLLKSNERI